MSDDRSKVNPASGFTERRKTPRRERPGELAWDDRGNALYAWRDERMLEDGEDGESRRLRALSVANLVLVDDDPPPEGKKISLNKQGVRQGYNPYDSGMLKKESYRRPKDLRALSKWIEMQNKPQARDDEES